MQNFIQFLVRFHAFFLFIGLEIFCFYLLIQQHHFQRTRLANTANQVTGTVYESVSGVQGYVGLKSQNDSLVVENARLKEELQLLQSYFTTKDTLITDTICIDTSALKIYNYVSAKVIKNSTNQISNFLTIDRGTNDGIYPEMGIISSNGIVGITKVSSPNYSVVMSVLHKDMRVSSKIFRNGYVGTLRWYGNDPLYATLEDIPKHVEILPGDTIVSSGFSSFFPADILVGIVESSRLKESNFYDIKVQLSTNFSTLRYVYAVQYEMQREVLELEAQSLNE